MGDAWIISTARTAIGTAGLGTTAVAAAVDRAGLDRALVDDVVMSESRYGGGDMARHVAIRAGLEDVAGLAHNRHCAGGLAAVTTAAGSVRAGMDQVVVAGGVESASTSPRSRRRILGTDEWEEWAPPSHPETPDAPCEDMSITVGWNAAVQAGVTRDEMDAWALRSHQRAIAAIDADSFRDEIVPLEVTRRDGTRVTFAVDEHPRRDTTLEKLASLKVIHPEIEGFSITAGNSSGRNDGAAALVVADAALASAAGVEPLAAVRAWASVGVPPAETGLAPVKAIPKALGRAGLDIGDVDLWEINEAFAAMCVGTVRQLGLDDEIVNVVGSGCSLGHPVAMTGARMIISLTHELRRRGGGTAARAQCGGGGQSTAGGSERPP